MAIFVAVLALGILYAWRKQHPALDLSAPAPRRSGEAAAGDGRRAVAADRRPPCRAPGGSRAPGGRGTPGRPARPTTAVAASVPSSRWSTGRSRVSPTKSLLDSATSTGQPVADQLVEPAGELQRVPGVLAEVVRRVDEDAVRGVRPAPPPGRRGAVTVATTSATTSAKAARCGRVRGRRPPACEQTSPAPVAAATSASPGSAPAQVSLIRSAPAATASVATSARQVSIEMTTSGKRRPDRGDGGDRAADLLGGVDVVARAGLDPADVDDVGAVRDRPLDRAQGGVVGEGGAPVEERVRRAVHDRHHREVGRAERARSSRSRHAASHPPVTSGRLAAEWTPGWRGRPARRGMPRSGVWVSYFLIVVVALTVAAVVFGVTVLVTGSDPGLTPAEPDGRAVPLPGDPSAAGGRPRRRPVRHGGARLPDGAGRPGAAPGRVRHRLQGRADRGAGGGGHRAARGPHAGRRRAAPGPRGRPAAHGRGDAATAAGRRRAGGRRGRAGRGRAAPADRGAGARRPDRRSRPAAAPAAPEPGPSRRTARAGRRSGRRAGAGEAEATAAAEAVDEPGDPARA